MLNVLSNAFVFTSRTASFDCSENVHEMAKMLIVKNQSKIAFPEIISKTKINAQRRFYYEYSVSVIPVVFFGGGIY